MLALLGLSLAATEEDLRAQVLAEQPRLAEEGLSDWERVKLLRRFAYDHSDTVVSAVSPLYSGQAGWPVADRCAFFDADQGGVICGGTGDALRLLYELWGYEAWYLGFGDPSSGGFTHVETLVAIEHEGERLDFEGDEGVVVGDSGGTINHSSQPAPTSPSRARCTTSYSRASRASPPAAARPGARERWRSWAVCCWRGAAGTSRRRRTRSEHS